MVDQRWPFPGDAPVTIARKVAGAYRELALSVAPDRVDLLDARMVEWGQSWVAPRVRRFHLDDWLSLRDAADFAGVAPETVSAWRRRHLIDGRNVGGRWEYRAGDLLSVAANLRRRKRIEKA